MLDCDRYSTAELDALESAQLYHLMNELYGEIKRIAAAKKQAKLDEKSAKIALLRDPRNIDLKAKVLEAQAMLIVLGYEYQARQEQTKIIQTQVNTLARLAR